MFRIFAVVSLAMLCATATAQSHCTRDEITYFSCQILHSTKIASLCGGYTDPNRPASFWLQYRFGKLHQTEFVYPATPANSTKHFEIKHFGTYNTLSVLFINEKALYEVELSQGYRGARKTITAAVNVETNQKRTALPCSPPVRLTYWDDLIELSAEISQSAGGVAKDLLYRLHNPLAK